MLGIVHALRQDTGAAPDERLAGLSLVARAVRMLAQRGAQRVLVLVRAADRGRVPDLSDERVPVVTLIVAGSLAEALREHVDEPFLLARHDVIAEGSIYAELTGWARGSAAARGGQPIGPLYAQPALLAGDGDLTELATRLEPLDVGARFAIELRSEADRRRAVDALFESCRKPVDGLVSRHLNRHISLFLSRRLVDTPVTPNQMTVITFAVGVAAAWLASRGGYRDTLAGAALMQLNSILDGCDGELARVRLQGSRLGEWLDTIGDDFTNVLYWGGLALGARSIAQHGELLAAAGWIAAGANALAALLSYRQLARLGTGDLYAVLPSSSGIALVLKQDFFLFFLLLVALTGYLHYLLPVIALGALVTLGAALYRAKSK